VLALEHLHSEGLIYRNLVPENISIDMYGYVQLMDLHFAFKLDDAPAQCRPAPEPAPLPFTLTLTLTLTPTLTPTLTCSGRDYSGRADYLSPEQVSGQGHSQPVDFWALGVLVYEMLTGSGPWITDDDNKNSDVTISP